MIVTQETIDLLFERKIYTALSISLAKSKKSLLKPGDSLSVGVNTIIEPFTQFWGKHIPSMGSFSYICSELNTKTEIGRYSSVASAVRIFGDEHPYERFTTSPATYFVNNIIFASAMEEKQDCSFQTVHLTPPPKVKIGNDVWIGSHVALKPGVTIHDGAVIATGAIVTKDVPPYSIVGGVPAKVIKMRFSDNIIEELMNLKWWEYNFIDFKNICGDIQVEEFIEKIKQEISDGNLKKYSPAPLTGSEILATAKK